MEEKPDRYIDLMLLAESNHDAALFLLGFVSMDLTKEAVEDVLMAWATVSLITPTADHGALMRALRAQLMRRSQ